VRDAEGDAEDSDTPVSAPPLRRYNLFATLLTLVPSAKSGAEAEWLIQGLASCPRSLSQHAAMCFENAANVGEGAPPTGKADAAARRLREYAAEWSGFECADGEQFIDLRSRLRRHAFDRQRNEEEARRLFAAEPEDTLWYFPSFPIVRLQPFPRKILPAKGKIMGAINDDEFEAESCTKRYNGKVQYTHGVLTIM
jgi:hypothetical protein